MELLTPLLFNQALDVLGPELQSHGRFISPLADAASPEDFSY